MSTQMAPEVPPTTYPRVGHFTSGKVTEPVAGNVRHHVIQTKAPTHMGSSIPWRVTDEDPDVTREYEAANTFAGRPLGARFHCLKPGCEWWATKVTSTVKHGRKVGHEVKPV